MKNIFLAQLPLKMGAPPKKNLMSSPATAKRMKPDWIGLKFE
jgi:hypothetical protein